MPGYRRVRYVDRPTYYTNTPGDPGPIFVGTMSSYFYKVSEVLAAIAPAVFAANLNQWYNNDTGANINYTNTTTGFVQVFTYATANKSLSIDRIMANGTKTIYNGNYFAIYDTTEQSVPIIDMLGQIMFRMMDTNGETSDSRYRGIILDGTNYLYLTYKRYTAPAASEESRTVTGFDYPVVTNEPVIDLNEEIDDHLNHINDDEYNRQILDDFDNKLKSRGYFEEN